MTGSGAGRPSSPSVVVPGSALPLSARAPGPDVARGIALLGITIANTVHYLHGSSWNVLFRQRGPGPLDRAVDVVIALLVDNRGFPLFALLFGYGIGVLWRRSRERGEGAAGFLARTGRRHLLLLVLGILHATLLFTGDILRAYALLGSVLMLAAARGRGLVVLTGAVGSVGLLWYGWADGVSGLTPHAAPPVAADVVAPQYLTSVADRLPTALVELVTSPMIDIGLLTPMVIGALLASSRMLEDVDAHRALLRRLSTWGIGIGLVGALPLALVLASDRLEQLLHHTAVLGPLGILHQVTGIAGALGAAALAALLTGAARTSTGGTSSRAGGAPALTPASALAALGRLSLTAYLLQSAGAAVLLSRWGADLGSRLGTAGAAGLCVALWALTLVLAVLLSARGRRGPFELLLRRVAYVERRAA